tara:strand:- start:179 stop:1351 length:1173 start_codon:yes stop_codon:yes gene_type:complete
MSSNILDTNLSNSNSTDKQEFSKIMVDYHELKKSENEISKEIETSDRNKLIKRCKELLKTILILKLEISKINNYNIDTKEKQKNENIEQLEKSINYMKFISSLESLKDKLDCLNDEAEEKANIIDLRYNYLNNFINYIHISIIVISALSSLLQGSVKITNIKELYITFVSLFISTYTGLILSILKYLKYESEKEKTHNLQERFANYILTIKSLTDSVNKWSLNKYWITSNEEQKKCKKIFDNSKWLEEEKIFNNNYDKIIDDKKNIYYDYEKLINLKAQRYFMLKYRKILLKNDILKKKNNISYYADNEFNICGFNCIYCISEDILTSIKYFFCWCCLTNKHKFNSQIEKNDKLEKENRMLIKQLTILNHKNNNDKESENNNSSIVSCYL